MPKTCLRMELFGKDQELVVGGNGVQDLDLYCMQSSGCKLLAIEVTET